MKSKIFVIAGFLAIISILFFADISFEFINNANDSTSIEGSSQNENKDYSFPSFYRGIYLSTDSATNKTRLLAFIKKARDSYVNTFVMDVQTYRYKKVMVPKELVSECIKNGIHPIARVVVFPGGLNRFPVNKEKITHILDIAEEAAKNGFKEIQFDYIRFSDENRHAKRLKHVSIKERYDFIAQFFKDAKKRLEPYNVRIAADVFGRIPHNLDDRIGQKMEILDTAVDIICPMAYPSHYWTRKMQHDPYSTVKWTSTEANKRTKKAAIVTYIQAFKMCHPPNMSFKEYVKQQVQATHDSKIQGFFLWNASQKYSVSLKAVTEFYKTKESKNIHNL